MNEINARNVGVVGDQAHIEGGQHFHTHNHFTQAVSPTGKPMHRPPRAEHFMGRDAELKELLPAIGPCQVATLCGPAGMGKSALAAEAIWRIFDGEEPPAQFPDGLVFHNFYDQSKVDYAFEVIARAFGVDPHPNPFEAAKNALSNRRALIVLDGAEDADDLSKLLDIRNQCGVFITSRRRQDALSHRQDVKPLKADHAVELLRAWGKKHCSDEKSAKALCKLVGYLPLAVRLVGRYLDQTEEPSSVYLTWLKQTPLDALNQGDRCDESIPILMERSLEQVSDQAHQVLSIVGVLAMSPFDRNIVAAAFNQTTDSLRRPFNELVNFGFLIRSENQYETSHALVHTYANSKLVPASEHVDALAFYYTQYVNDQRKLEAKGFKSLHSQRQHVMAVMSACSACQCQEAGNMLAFEYMDYLYLQGSSVDKFKCIQMGLRFAHDKYQDSVGTWLSRLGIAYYEIKGYELAIKYFQKSLVIARDYHDRKFEAATISNIGSVYHAKGDVDAAYACFQESLAIYRELEQIYVIQKIVDDSDSSDWSLKDNDKRNEHDTFQINMKMDYRMGKACLYEGLAAIYEAKPDMGNASYYLRQALRFDREIGDLRGEASRLGKLGLFNLRQGDIIGAIDDFDHALSICHQLGYRKGEAEMLVNLGRAYMNKGDVDLAINQFQLAFEIVCGIEDYYMEVNCLCNLGLAYGNKGDDMSAVYHFQRALKIAREIGYREGEANQLANLGVAYCRQKKLDLAREFSQKALEIFEAIQSSTAQEVRQWLEDLQ